MNELADLADAIDDDPDRVRAVLADQLRYLIDEVEALKPLVGRVPDVVQAGRPTPDVLSMKEIYGALAARDEQVRIPRLGQMTTADAPPVFDPIEDAALVADADWNEQPLPRILDRVQSARAALIDQLEALAPVDWSCTAQFGDDMQSVYEMAHRIAREDADRLRDLGYRLHEANLTDRERDLPK
jgi:hypothetical protein